MNLFTKSDSRKSTLFFQRVVCLVVLGTLALGIGIAVLDKKKITDFLAGLKWFHIRTLEVGAAWPVTEIEVRNWLPPLVGRSIILVNANELIVHLKKKTWIEDVLVKKRYPDRLCIQIKAKRAKAILQRGSDLFFVDFRGQVIEKVKSEILEQHPLPVISENADELLEEWEMLRAISILDTFHEKMQQSYMVSQLLLNPFPFFSIFLSSPQVELEFDFFNWEPQLSNLLMLLTNPPGQVGQINRISLLFPKKAVVRSALSN